MAFVAVFLVIVFSLTSLGNRPLFPEIELPVIAAEPVGDIGDRLIVTVTTTDRDGREPGPGHLGAVRRGECRVFIGDGFPVNSAELYDQAFTRIDTLMGLGRGPDIDWKGDVVYPAYLRAHAQVPWHCVGGSVYLLEAAGYKEIRFLTTPVA